MTTYKFSLSDYPPFAIAKGKYDKIKAAVDAVELVKPEEMAREADRLKRVANSLAVDALLDESLKKQADTALGKAKKAEIDLADAQAMQKNLNIAFEKARDEMEIHREAAEMLVYEKAKVIHRKLVKNLFATVRAYSAAYEEEVALSRAVQSATAKIPPSHILPSLLPVNLYMGREDDYNSPISHHARRAQKIGYEV